MFINTSTEKLLKCSCNIVNEYKMYINVKLICNVLQTRCCLTRRKFSEPTFTGFNEFYCISKIENFDASKNFQRRIIAVYRWNIPSQCCTKKGLIHRLLLPLLESSSPQNWQGLCLKWTKKHNFKHQLKDI